MNCNIISALVLAGLFTTTTALAQDAEAPDSTRAWTKAAVGGLSLTQSTYDNWTGGGENALAFKATADVKAEKATDRLTQIHSVQFAFGQTKTGDLDFRKVDDLIRYTLELMLQNDSKFKPTFALDARTQLADGFDYGIDPDGHLISRFLSPAFVTETIGVTYEPESWIKARFGMAGRQIIVTEERLRDPSDPAFAAVNGYGNDPDESLRFKTGMELALLGERQLVENVLLKSELGVFDSFTNVGSPDVRWKNLLQFKINAYLNANLEAELLYDEDQSSDIQWRQVLSLGLAVNIL
jgi:hypothetical protein